MGRAAGTDMIERGFARIGVLALALVGCSGGQSPTAIDCEHTQFADSRCCTAQAECEPNMGTCAPPGTAFGCGFCSSDPGTCAVDADCKTQSPSAICEPKTCACEGQRECVAGCTSDAACGEGQSCDLLRARCAPTGCATEADCPANFACTGQCLRKTCTDSHQCDGFCVDGECFETAGECRLPVG